jgi:hypothetical protein
MSPQLITGGICAQDLARAQRRLWRFMASKTKVTPQKEEMPEKEGPETSPDGPLLDLLENRTVRLRRGGAYHRPSRALAGSRGVRLYQHWRCCRASLCAETWRVLGRQLRGEAAGAARFRSHLGTGRSAGSSRAKRGAQGWPRRLRRYPHERYSGFSVPAALGGAGTSLGRQSHAK